MLRTTNAWTTKLRVAAAATLLGAAYLVQIPLETKVPGEPFVLFLVVVLACTLAFGQNVGFFALFMSTLLSACFFEPGLSLEINRAADLAAIELYALLGALSVLALSRLMSSVNEAYENTRLLADAEQKKALLMREMAHRVANNFASVAALIKRKAAATEDPAARLALDEAMEQVSVMARIHNRLRIENNSVVLDSREFMSDLCDDLRRTIGDWRPLTIECTTDDIQLSLAQAVPLGLIVNELITNAMKYAFPDERCGAMYVSLLGVGGQLRLTVSDDGTGFSGTIKGTGKGCQIVAALSQQLRGTVDSKSTAKGTTTSVTFPAEGKERLVAVTQSVSPTFH
ncbi:sensor histidine kinase [Hyphomicrobium sp.]|uniref:sensor histidine kinase n=1 Tax=Hyphomicrobium sp. TaxID=82 RepID=UPI003F6E49C0